MKRVLAITIFTLVLGITLYAPKNALLTHAHASPKSIAQDGQWVNFHSEVGRFTVLMPETPQEKIETANSAHGPYTTHSFVVRDASCVYLLGWADYDPSFNFNRQAELEANRDNFVKGISATLIDSSSTTIDGYSVLEFTAETADHRFKSRVYMVGRRPYQLIVGFPKEETEPAVIGRFFGSFKVQP